MPNDPAKDRYNPPRVGSEFDVETFSEINPGELFRLYANNNAKMYRKSSDNFAFDIKEQVELQFNLNETVYVKS